MQNTPRFYITSEQIEGNVFNITDNTQIKKITNILRLKQGDKIILFNGVGKEFTSTINTISNTLITGNIQNETFKSTHEKFSITLAQALPKAGKIDDIVRMCTEVGVASFIFFESDYSIPKLKDYKPSKLERLNKVIIEASRQCERAYIPEILEMTTFTNVIKKYLEHSKIMLSTQSAQEQNIENIKTDLLKNNVKEIILIIGPEGGFSEKEIELANQNNLIITKLNLPILRTETAGVVVAGYFLI